MAVHNHGTEEGEGLACREVLVNGELKGACLRSDDLRTRIAKVLLQNHPTSLLSHDEAHDAADALILQLGLRPELGQRSKPTGPLWGGNNRYNVTRYVTEWKNNDE
jgi:hypothetical protein